MNVVQSQTKIEPQDPLDAKERLRQSALKLFSERGYTATSIREIIEDAGVTRPVLYYYFKNKEDLFSHLVRSQFERVRADLDDITARHSSCRDRLRAVVVATFGRAQESPEMVRILLQFFFSPPIKGMDLDKGELSSQRFERIVEIMRQGLESG